ncbi:hypothetical protein LHYA1_G005870 [Lachnellula hyalina]|uniref:Zn(2)-C6 fungal-type domain-containing protein n=1 Tax=Lachnellula hyalina TaxID=1316788 RepID=A0A8H8R2Z9_9HELO|nr:uncharacterized protein LHYA1_G005870 [Lachnellula hyalina]TVY25954.1 hypothetical protein LHYA1_G005870 [Lachnellula hyalina]
MPILQAIIHHESKSSEDAEHSRELRFFSNGELTPPFTPLTSFDCPGTSSTMSEGNQVPPNDSLTSLTPDEANKIIHSHRKVRYAPPSEAKSSRTSAGTACWPCRQRKVKCDNKHPCENCVKRDHASLCSYNPKQNATKQTASVAGNKRPRSPGSASSSRKEDDRWPRTTGESHNL